MHKIIKAHRDVQCICLFNFVLHTYAPLASCWRCPRVYHLQSALKCAANLGENMGKHPSAVQFIAKS